MSYHRFFQTKLANSVFTYALHKRTSSNRLQDSSSLRSSLRFEAADGLGHGWLTNKLLAVIGGWLAQSSEDGAIGLGNDGPKS